MKPILPPIEKPRSLGGYAAAALVGGFIGVLLSRNFFEGEKKVTHSILVDYEVEHPQFTRTMSQLLGPPLVDGNSITILENGAEIFPAMLEAIASAQRTITMENFVFTHGRVTMLFTEALAAASMRGVNGGDSPTPYTPTSLAPTSSRIRSSTLPGDLGVSASWSMAGH